MNRRDFLKGILTSSALAYTLDIDKLLWIPNERTIFLPPMPTIITINEFQLMYGRPYTGKYGLWLANKYEDSEIRFLNELLGILHFHDD